MRGLFRVDDESRVVIQARWWKAAAPVPFDHLVRRHAETLRGRGDGVPPRFKPMDGLRLPAGPDDRSQAFRAEVATPDDPLKREILVIWQRSGPGRLLMLRFLIEAGRPNLDRIRTMLSGLHFQGVEEPRDWAALDFALRVPPGYRLETGVLRAGVCYLEFRNGRRMLALRRFSAANAVMGVDAPTLDDLERWCRKTYADSFYDMRYQVERTIDPVGRPLLRLTGRRRLLAPVELKWLIPRHRRLPRRIDLIWDPGANKIYSVELLRPDRLAPADIDGFEASLRMTLSPESADAEATLAGEPIESRRRARLRSLRARVRRMPDAAWETNERGRVVLRYWVERPRALRLLRFLGAMPPGPERRPRHLELDLIGTRVWEACEARPRVCDLIAEIRERFRISHREAELSVTEFIRVMGSRGLLGVELEPVA